jgi:hypothetical protein
MSSDIYRHRLNSLMCLTNQLVRKSCHTTQCVQDIIFTINMSEEYWIISVPGKSTPRQSYDEVCEATSREQLSVNYFFNIPDLKVQLMHESSSKFFNLS